VPDEDQGYFFAALVLPDGSSVERTDAVVKRAEAFLKTVPGIQHYPSLQQPWSRQAGKLAPRVTKRRISRSQVSLTSTRGKSTLQCVAILPQSFAGQNPCF
jgi:multidrug efflux pump subunit AcrB